MSINRHAPELPEVATDLTSWYGFLAYLVYGLDTEWARNNYLDITVLRLIGADLRCPLPPADPVGPGFELQPLRDHFGLATDDSAVKAAAKEHQEKRVRDPLKAQALRKFLDALIHRDESWPGWLSWHREHEWSQHFNRCHGLVEEGNEHLVSILVPEVTADKIIDINKQAVNDPGFCKAATAQHERLFTADVMIRGVYYEYVARALGREHVFHQTRRTPIAPEDGIRERTLVLGFEPFVLARLVKQHTEKVAGRQERVAAWAKAVGDAKTPLSHIWKLQSPDSIDLSKKALNAAAVRVGRMLDEMEFSVKTRVHQAAEHISAGIGSGAGFALGFALETFIGGSGFSGGLLGGTAGAILGSVLEPVKGDVLAKWFGRPSHAARRIASKGPARVRSSLILRGQVDTPVGALPPEP